MNACEALRSEKYVLGGGGAYVVMSGVVLVDEVMGVWVVFYKNITEFIK